MSICNFESISYRLSIPTHSTLIKKYSTKKMLQRAQRFHILADSYSWDNFPISIWYRNWVSVIVKAFPIDWVPNSQHFTGLNSRVEKLAQRAPRTRRQFPIDMHFDFFNESFWEFRKPYYKKPIFVKKFRFPISKNKLTACHWQLN